MRASASSASYTRDLSNSGGTAERWSLSLPVQPPASQRTGFAIAWGEVLH